MTYNIKKIKNNQLGIITFEILIAMAILIIVISAVLPLVSGDQSISVDSQTNQEALYKAQALLEDARATSRSDFNSVITTTLTSDDIYQKQTMVDPDSITQCGKDVKSIVTWTTENRPLNIELTSHFSDIYTAMALGGNCDDNPPSDGWNPPDTWASSNFNPGSPTGLDALNRIVYMTGNGNPNSTKNFYIANTNGVAEGVSSGLFVNFANNFMANARLNDVKVAKLSDGKIYAFVARNTTTNQFQVIDVSDIFNPISVGIFQLANVNSSGSYPQAWRIYYYNNRVYVVTRYTAGPELHIFDVSNPASISEMGNGTELGLTANGFIIAEKNISGTLYKFAYMATSSDSKELLVLDVTDPLNVTEISNATRNLSNPDYADGNTVFLIGNNLYFGRDSSNPDDLYVFNAANPFTAVGGLPIVQSVNIGTSVIGLVVSGSYIFISTPQSNSEFQVWTSDPANTIVKVNTTNYNFPNMITLGNGLKYEDDWVYVASQANDALRILYNNP